MAKKVDNSAPGSRPGPHKRKAWRLRQKREEQTLTAIESEWLTRYERHVGGLPEQPEDSGLPGSDEESEDEESDKEPETPHTDQVPTTVPEQSKETPTPSESPGTVPVGVGTPAPKVDATPKVSIPKVRPNLTAPPKFDIDPKQDSRDSKPAKWQDKYRGGTPATAALGREQTCQFIGGQWFGILVGMQQQLTECGVKPLMDVNNQEVLNAIVLTVDNLIPDEVKITPEVIAVASTTTVITQMFFNRKKLKEHLEKKKSENDLKANIVEMTNRREKEYQEAQERNRIAEENARKNAEAVKAINEENDRARKAKEQLDKESRMFSGESHNSLDMSDPNVIV